MKINNKITALRKLMKKYAIDVYIIPSTDPHQSEYIANYWKAREWISGFTGSAGTVVITQNHAGLWTDSRYFIQAEKQLADSEVELHKMITRGPEYLDWIIEMFSDNICIGFDGKSFSVENVKELKNALSRKNLSIKSDIDLIDIIWTERPEMPMTKLFVHDIAFAGKSRIEKINMVRAEMKNFNADYFLLSSLDDIAWLLNIRAADVDYNPVAISFVLVSMDNLIFFVDDKKLSDDIKKILKNDNITIKPYKDVENYLRIINDKSSIVIDPKKTNFYLYNFIPSSSNIIEKLNITTSLKAVKNSVEIKNFKQTMIYDGIAMTKFIYWLEKNIGKQKITEISASDKLEELRRQQKTNMGLSCATIAGYNAHGAIVHYDPTHETDVELKAEGLFLLDSGGQYLGGTTDLTRTIPLGKPTNEQIHDYTLVLKGHINLATVKFPLGTKGYQIDVLARKPIWEGHKNYGHGTGHGVGYYLNIHEGPQALGAGATADKNTFFVPGMLITDEPGIYIKDKYGIRIENLMLCVEDAKVEDYGLFLKFETLTLCPIDTSLIDISMLNKKEKKWLNNYHKNVYDKLVDYLDEDEKLWLKKKTQPI